MLHTARTRARRRRRRSECEDASRGKGREDGALGETLFEVGREGEGCGRSRRRSRFDYPARRSEARRRALPVVLGAWSLELVCVAGSGSADGGRVRVGTRKGRKTTSVGRQGALWQLWTVGRRSWPPRAPQLPYPKGNSEGSDVRIAAVGEVDVGGGPRRRLPRIETRSSVSPSWPQLEWESKAAERDSRLGSPRDPRPCI